MGFIIISIQLIRQIFRDFFFCLFFGNFKLWRLPVHERDFDFLAGEIAELFGYLVEEVDDN